MKILRTLGVIAAGMMALSVANAAQAETRVTLKSAKAASSYYQMAAQFAEAMKTGTNGDVIVTVRVGGHPLFSRSGLDVSVDIPVTVVEAIRGMTISVPLLQGEVELRIPEGSSSGQKLRITGKGIEDPSGRKGDFFAVVQIRAPKGSSLSDAGQEALDSLAADLPNPREGLDAFS